jgi:hypothetical protein
MRKDCRDCVFVREHNPNLYDNQRGHFSVKFMCHSPHLTDPEKGSPAEFERQEEKEIWETGRCGPEAKFYVRDEQRAMRPWWRAFPPGYGPNE